MSLAAARLRERVTFQTPPATPDGAGGYEGSWTNYLTAPTVSAEVAPTGGREQLLAGAQAGVQGFRVMIRYRSDVATGHRLVWRGRNLNIRSAEDPDGQRQSLVIYADAGADA